MALGRGYVIRAFGYRSLFPTGASLIAVATLLLWTYVGWVAGHLDHNDRRGDRGLPTPVAARAGRLVAWTGPGRFTPQGRPVGARATTRLAQLAERRPVGRARRGLLHGRGGERLGVCGAGAQAPARPGLGGGIDVLPSATQHGIV
jgi:hypothetical protein